MHFVERPFASLRDDRHILEPFSNKSLYNHPTVIPLSVERPEFQPPFPRRTSNRSDIAHDNPSAHFFGDLIGLIKKQCGVVITKGDNPV